MTLREFHIKGLIDTELDLDAHKCLSLLMDNRKILHPIVIDIKALEEKLALEQPRTTQHYKKNNIGQNFDVKGNED